MTPRGYQLGLRAGAAEETRARILKAAWGLLAPGAKTREFSLDAVARLAGVSRMTVYNQFGSKRGLLEALFDSFAEKGKIGELVVAAFQAADPLESLDQLVVAFATFFSKARIPIKRVRALAMLDPELEAAVLGRDERRRDSMRAIATRLAKQGKLSVGKLDETVAVLHMLTSFEAFDTLSGKSKKFMDVVPVLQRLCRAAVGAQ